MGPSRGAIRSDRKKKKKKRKIFLSPVAGQVVDVGASRARRLPCSQSGSNSIRSKKKKKKSENFSKSRGRPSSRCRSVSGPPTALLPVGEQFDPIEKKSENFSKSRGRPSSRCRSVSGP